VTVPPTGLLKALFPAAIWQRGVSYQRAGFATVSRVGEDGTYVVGTVDGTRSRPYKTEVRLALGHQGRLTLRANCSCPMGTTCKHVVALLLQAAGERSLAERFMAHPSSLLRLLLRERTSRVSGCFLPWADRAILMRYRSFRGG